MRMMIAGGHTSGGEDDSSYNGGHQLNQRDVSFGHDDESGTTGRESIEVCSANNILQRQSMGRPGPRMSEQNSVFSQKQ
jgi:hypothetical protein